MSVDLEWYVDKCDIGCGLSDTRVLLESYILTLVLGQQVLLNVTFLSFIVCKRGFKVDSSSLLYQHVYMGV